MHVRRNNAVRTTASVVNNKCKVYINEWQD